MVRSAVYAAWVLVFSIGSASGQTSDPIRPWELRSMVAERSAAALRVNDLVAAAEIHADFGREALRRARAAHDAWMRLHHTETSLFPQSTRVNEWNYRHVAADLFCFLWIVSARMQAPSLSKLMETLEAESKLAMADDLCPSVRWDDGSEIPGTRSERMFGMAEYAKDGLISVCEATGDERARDRLEAVVRCVLAHSAEPSPFGLLPSSDSEVNGNMLQVLCRLGCEAGGDEHAESAASIASAVIETMLPANHGLPARAFRYDRGQALDATVMLRDHGNELIPGLGEAYALAVSLRDDAAWAARAACWREPLLAMYERILAVGIRDDGLLVSAVDASTGRHLDPRPNDNWGYIACGALALIGALEREGNIEAPRAAALLKRLDLLAAAAAASDDIEWEAGTHDGEADTIESALYFAAYRPSSAEELLPWVHRRIGKLFAHQRDDGFVGGTYLDGNFMRTAMLYAEACGGGWMLSPPSDGVSIGLACKDGDCVLILRSLRAYAGTLKCPGRWTGRGPRLAWDWPRINSWPRWSVGENMIAVESATGLAQPPNLDELRSGLALRLEPGDRVVIRWRFSREREP